MQIVVHVRNANMNFFLRIRFSLKIVGSESQSKNVEILNVEAMQKSHKAVVGLNILVF